MLRFRNEPGSTDDNSITPYVLQFANCDRIEKNDAVYIFDEVGSGKTIMAGLMALHYLYNSPGQKVLVITTPALSHSGPCNTQKAADETDKIPCAFLRDWYEKLPIRDLSMEDRVTVISNNYSPIGKEPIHDYGMVIIDEAHEFLNCGIKRLKRRENLEAHYSNKTYTATEKVVFLTASPIKECLADMKKYCDLAQEMLKKPILPEDSEECEKLRESFFDQIFGEKFDRFFPATRWFKDEVSCLANFNAPVPLRQPPELWTWSNKPGKNAALLMHICETLQTAPDSRFLIFARWVTQRVEYDDVQSIRECLVNSGCPELSEDQVKVITGINSQDLKDYSGKGKNENLPRVLILNYQVAEAGLNLPGYNYVVNYHISAYPSALEQRFGRVDRLNSEYKTIHSCYLLRQEEEKTAGEEDDGEALAYWDTDTNNFRDAVQTYLHGVLPCLPSRNVMLSKDVFDIYDVLNSRIEQELSTLKRWKNDEKAFCAYQAYVKGDNNVPNRYGELIGFFRRKDADEERSDANSERARYKEILQQEIRHLKECIDRRLPPEKYQKIRKYISDLENAQITNTQNAIFFEDMDGQFETIQTQDCVAGIQKHAKDFAGAFEVRKTQIKNFHKCQSHIIDSFERHKQEIESYFREEFVGGRLENVFPVPSADRVERGAFYYEKLSDILKGLPACEALDTVCKQFLAEYLEKHLDFFKMCQSFWKQLELKRRWGDSSFKTCMDDWIKGSTKKWPWTKHTYNYFKQAYDSQDIKVWRNQLGLPEEREPFYICSNEQSDNNPKASPWYQLTAEFVERAAYTETWKAVWRETFLNSWIKTFRCIFWCIWDICCQESLPICLTSYIYSKKLMSTFKEDSKRYGEETYSKIITQFWKGHMEFPRVFEYSAAWAYKEALKEKGTEVVPFLDNHGPNCYVFKAMLADAEWEYEKCNKRKNEECNEKVVIFPGLNPNEIISYMRSVFSTEFKAALKNAFQESVRSLALEVFCSAADEVSRRVENLAFAYDADLIKILHSELKRTLSMTGFDTVLFSQAERSLDDLLRPVCVDLVNAYNEKQQRRPSLYLCFYTETMQ